jgi:hypothetical protein
MKIDRFKSQMDSLQRGNRYNVAMFGTGAKVGGLAVRGLKCDSATLPGRGFFTLEDSEYGPKRVIPHKAQYDSFDCSFYMTNDFEERELIELWQNNVGGIANGNSGFHSRFADDYTGVVYVEMLDKYDNVNYRCIMVEAFPIQLSVVNLGYEVSDTMKFNAQFRYRYWHSEFTNSKPSNLFVGFMDKHLNKFTNKVKGKIENAIFK